jgi:hypothetical protein
VDDSQTIFETLHAIIGSIDPNQSNADWGREFGDVVFETDDEALIRYVLSDAGEKYRSGELTKLRKKASNAAFDLMKTTNGEKAIAAEQQLEMPIVVEGFPPLTLGQANHYFLRDACTSAERRIKGAIRNLRFWQRARDVSAPWPDDSIRTLIDRGDITPEMLVVSEETGS